MIRTFEHDGIGFGRILAAPGDGTAIDGAFLFVEELAASFHLPGADSVGQVDGLERSVANGAHHQLLFDTIAGVDVGPGVGGGRPARLLRIAGRRSVAAVFDVPRIRPLVTEGARHVLCVRAAVHKIVLLQPEKKVKKVHFFVIF